MSKVEVTTPLTHAGLRNKSKEWLIDTLVLAGNANAWNEQEALKAKALNAELLEALKQLQNASDDVFWDARANDEAVRKLNAAGAHAETVIAMAEGRL